MIISDQDGLLFLPNSEQVGPKFSELREPQPCNVSSLSEIQGMWAVPRDNYHHLKFARYSPHPMKALWIRAEGTRKPEVQGPEPAPSSASAHSNPWQSCTSSPICTKEIAVSVSQGVLRSLIH